MTWKRLATLPRRRPVANIGAVVGQYHFYICGTKYSRLFLNFSGFGIVLMVRDLAQVQTELGRHTSSGSCPGGSLNGALLELGLVCPIDGSKIQALKLPNLM